MQKTLAFIVIALFFGTGFGFLLAVSTGARLDGHDHGAHDHGAEETAHEGHAAAHGHDAMIDLTADVNAPSLDMALHSESGGWNLELKTQNFRFAPDNVNGPHIAGEGHAHVYVDGTKIARIYGPWFHIGVLPDGAKTLTVTLNGNDHSPLAIGGIPLAISCALPECQDTFTAVDQ